MVDRIILCGASSVGKTTVANEWCQKYKYFKHIQEVARDVMRQKSITRDDMMESLKTEEKCLFLKLQEDILDEQNRRELAVPQGCSYISDRGPDPLIFAMQHVSLSAANRLAKTPSAESCLERYRKSLVIVLCPLNKVTDDGFRLVPKSDQQREFTSLLCQLLHQHYVPFIYIAETDHKKRMIIIENACKGYLHIPLDVSNENYHPVSVLQEEDYYPLNIPFIIKRKGLKQPNISLPVVQFSLDNIQCSFKDFQEGRSNRMISRYGMDQFFVATFDIKVPANVVHKVLNKGLLISGELFSFLGCSSSGIKNRTCYLYKGNGAEVEALLNECGSFSQINSVSVRMKRIGLLFSEALPTGIDISDDDVIETNDIERGGSNFTDGCGAISKHLAATVKFKANIEMDSVPSVFQIRYQGCKGVLMIDPSLKDNRIMIGNSMKKFSPGTKPFPELWLCDYSRPYSYGHLNKQFIMLLSGLGVEDSVLLSKQNDHFKRLEEMVVNPEIAVMMLQWSNQPDVALTIARCSGEQFQSNKSIRNQLLRLKSKLCGKLEKLSILISESRTVFGVCDPHGILKYGECFFRPTISGNPCTLSGYVTVAKNPCYLLGDIRCLKAISDSGRIKKLEHLVDCIVFPTEGPQPHSNEIAGSDLDGDQYFVCWDKDLIIKKMCTPYYYPASVYTKPTAKTSPLMYFSIQGNQSATMGKIDKFYKIWANRNGIGCRECEELGKHFAHSVDSAKTGVKITIPKTLIPPKDNTIEKGKQWVWIQMEEAASREKEKLKEMIISESDPEIISEEFVWSLVEDDNLNMSEYQIFSFVKHWCYHQYTDCEAHEKFLKFGEFIDYSKFSIDQQVAAIDVGIPKDVVCNALNKSQLFTPAMLTHFSLNSPHSGWKFYFRLNSDKFECHHLLHALEKYPQTILILQLNAKIIVAFHFLMELKYGVSKLPPGSVVAYFFSQHFNLSQKYVLGPEYTIDLDEDTMQIYRGEKRATFVKLAFNENENISKQATSVINVGDRVSVDLTRFMPDILTKYKHPKVQKECVQCFEAFVKTMYHKPTYFDIYQTDYHGELSEQVTDFHVEEIPLSDGDIDEHKQSNTESFIPYCKEQILKELKLSAERGYAHDYYELLQLILTHDDNIDSLVSDINSSFINLLNAMVTNICQNIQYKGMEDIVQMILITLLDITQLEPKHLFQVLDRMFRLQFISSVSQILQRIEPLSPSDYFEVVGNWQLWYFVPQDQAHDLLNVIRPTCARNFEIPSSSQDMKSVGSFLDGDTLSYTVHFANLLLHQFIDELHQTALKDGHSSNPGIDRLKASNFTLVPSSNSDLSEPSKSKVTLTKATDITSSRHTIETYVTVSPMKSSSTLPIVAIGKIDTLCRQPTNILLELEEPVQSPLKLSAIQSIGHWQINVIGNVISFKRCMKAIRKLYSSKLSATTLLSCLVNPQDGASTSVKEPSIIPEENISNKVPLNESQAKAVAAAVIQDITLIHGPPGTGKTHTATEIVRCMLLKYSACKKKVLIAAETNMAVDNLTRKLLQMNVMVIRVGNIEHIATDIRHVSLKHQLDVKLRGLGKHSHKNHHTCSRDILNSAEVVATTCTGAGESDLKDMKFSFVIIDEATQATEPVSLIPIVHHCEQLVLIGDPQQLPPTLINTTDNTKGLTVSLFHRLCNVIPSFFLNIQHRMHPVLAKFPSNKFYDGKLMSDPGLVNRKTSFDAIWQGHQPLAFINVASSREQCYGKSYQNTAEADKVVDVIRKLLSNSVQQSEIVVLTPYAGQVKCVAEKVGLVAKCVEVCTIDGFQGREKEIVLFSTVRTKCLGFTADRHRMNVLLTRAKHGIIGIGCYDLLNKDPMWSEWLEKVRVSEDFLQLKQSEVHSKLSKVRSGCDIPENKILKICKNNRCSYGVKCKFAHSYEELKEWRRHCSAGYNPSNEKSSCVQPEKR